MFRRRLRPAWSPEELAKIYAKPHDHKIYGYGHHLRVEHTIKLGQWMVADFKLKSGADLSCGNGAIINALPLQIKTLGDFASGYQLTGPLEETVQQIHPVDLFICSETIEHLDDPEFALEQIRKKSRFLLLSTPIGENDLGNPEHYHGWDVEAVEAMLNETGWKQVIARVELFTPNHGYNYQIVACR